MSGGGGEDRVKGQDRKKGQVMGRFLSFGRMREILATRQEAGRGAAVAAMRGREMGKNKRGPGFFFWMIKEGQD